MRSVLLLSTWLFVACSSSSRDNHTATTLSNDPSIALSTDQAKRLLCSEDALLHVTQDTIGPLPLQRTWDQLRALCPSADTGSAGVFDEEGEIAFVRFRFRGALVTAYQDVAHLDPGRGFSIWRIDGDSSVVLPQGIRLGSDWAAIKAALGPLQIMGADEGEQISATPCDLPNLTLLLWETPDSLSRGIAPYPDSVLAGSHAYAIGVLVRAHELRSSRDALVHC